MEWKFRSDLPIYSQLVEQIKLGIVSGSLLPGERLMSVRDMATEAGVNPNTMQRALSQLETDGLVNTNRTAGRTVTEDTAVLDALRKRLAGEATERYFSDMNELGYTRGEAADMAAAEKERKE